MTKHLNLKDFLDKKVEQYNTEKFIATDPICIPHAFTIKQDVEITAFFAAIFSWGQRVTVINKSKDLIARFDNAPYDFIKNHKDSDLKALLGFKHRTFNDTDLLYCVHWLKHHYSQYESLEDAFIPHEECSMEESLIHFHNYFFSLPDAPDRTQKHIATPSRNSACKRLNMLLRWMVRQDDKGVDFGIWNSLSPSNLICPLDLHVERTASLLGLITKKTTDWKASLELTENLKCLDPNDPAKYDFALFGLSIEKKLNLDMPNIRKQY